LVNLNLNIRKYATFVSYEDVANNFRSDVEDLSFIEGVSRDYKNSLFSPKFKPFFFNNGLNCDEKRLLNFISLRSTTRSSIVTFNALQKVFRARFEEGRSNSDLNLFSNIIPDQPFLSASRPNYEELLGKTKNEFFSFTNFHKKATLLPLNLLFTKNTTNYAFFNFPFLLAPKSDMGRFIWFDWYAK
jgi:hypothetical protein